MWLTCFSDLEKNSQAAAKADGPGIPLGNTAYLMLDDEEDKTFLYSQLVDGYKWTEKVSTFIPHPYIP